MKVTGCLLSAFLCAFLLPANAAPAGAVVQIDTWLVPWPDTRPRDPDVAPSGKVWFVGQAGDYVARFDPET